MKRPIWLPETRTFIVGWMMISSFILVILCWWRPPPADNQIVVMLLSVYVSTGFVAALQYWVGTSKGSTDKDEVAANTARTLASAVNKQEEKPL